MSKTYTFLDLDIVNRPFLNEITEAINRVARSGRFIGGAEVDSFEHDLAAMTGTDFCVGTSNGLDALRMIFRALILLGRLNKGDEVLVPANTYIASVLAVTDAGLVPVFVDIDPSTSNMSAADAAKAAGPRTRAILPVHLYGRVCWNAALKSLATDHNLIVVEDNAQAIGAESIVPGLTGKTATGALGHAAAFSFYPTKNVGAMGDAGAVTTDDKELADAVRTLANYGSFRRYHNIYQGFNCRLDPMQAAVLRAKLPYTAKVNDERKTLAGIYLQHIQNPRILLPAVPLAQECVWHQFVVRTPQRDAFRRYLTDNGVGTDVNYPTVPYHQPCYSGLYGSVSCPKAEEQADTLICLPISACTSPGDAREIAEIINNYRS